MKRITLLTVALTLFLAACQPPTPLPQEITVVDDTFKAQYHPSKSLIETGACIEGKSLQDGTINLHWTVTDNQSFSSETRESQSFEGGDIVIDSDITDDEFNITARYRDEQNCYTARFNATTDSQYTVKLDASINGADTTATTQTRTTNIPNVSITLEPTQDVYEAGEQIKLR